MGKLNKKQKIFWIVWFVIIIIASILLSIFATGCTNKMQTQTIYEDRIITKIDTLVFISKDTIPCEDFKYKFITKKDTIFVEVVKKELKIKTIQRTDTIYKEKIILQNLPKKVVNKTIAKKGSAIGDGNKITTKKNNWWWIFLAGALSWFIIQNVVLRWLKTYFPFLKIFF